MTTLADLSEIASRGATPPIEWLSSAGRCRSLFYGAEPFKQRPTMTFAYLARPQHEGTRNPAIVLVHGGGGRAFPEWATIWAQRGYVAIAMDLAGRGPDGLRHPRGGPDQSDEVKFGGIIDGVEQSWMYHAVADTMHAVSLMASLPEVESSKIVLAGISWGAHVAEIVSALDPRVTAASYTYGCGFISGNQTWANQLDALSPELSALWVDEFDAANYLSDVKIPTLWITGAKDGAYPLDRFHRSLRLTQGPTYLRVTTDFDHGHEQGWSPIEICEFFNAEVAGGIPLPRLRWSSARDDQVEALIDSTTPIIGADLHYTFDRGAWRDRGWHSESAAVVGREVRAALPDRPVSACFLSVQDVRGTVVSTGHLEPGWPRSPDHGSEAGPHTQPCGVMSDGPRDDR